MSNVTFHLHVNMQSTASETIHSGYTVHIYSNIFEWCCVWLWLCMHALLCVSVFVSKWLSIGFVSPSPRASIGSTQSWATLLMTLWGHAAEKWTVGTLEVSLKSHGYLDEKHTLRGRGCTLVEMRCFTTWCVPCCSCKGLFCLQHWRGNLWRCLFTGLAYNLSFWLSS